MKKKFIASLALIMALGFVSTNTKSVGALGYGEAYENTYGLFQYQSSLANFPDTGWTVGASSNITRPVLTLSISIYNGASYGGGWSGQNTTSLSASKAYYDSKPSNATSTHQARGASGTLWDRTI